MTAADPFTRASPHWNNAMRTAGKSGAAFEWTGRGSLLRIPFTWQKAGGASVPSAGSRR